MTTNELTVDEAVSVDDAASSVAAKITNAKSINIKFDSNPIYNEMHTYAPMKKTIKLPPPHSLADYSNWKMEKYGYSNSKPDNYIKNLVQGKYDEYDYSVTNLKAKVFDTLKSLKLNKDVREALKPLIELDLVEIKDWTGLQNVKRGHYLNIDKVYEHSCNCGNKTCNKLHLENSDNWLRVNHVIYVYVGSNE